MSSSAADLIAIIPINQLKSNVELVLENFFHEFKTTGTSDINDNIPGTYELEQNYPNPFNPTTEIGFRLPEQIKVQLEIYDLLGRKVVTLIDAELPEGWHLVKWNAKSFASGVYFYKLQSQKYSKSRKLIILR